MSDGYSGRRRRKMSRTQLSILIIAIIGVVLLARYVAETNYTLSHLQADMQREERELKRLEGQGDLLLSNLQEIADQDTLTPYRELQELLQGGTLLLSADALAELMKKHPTLQEAEPKLPKLISQWADLEATQQEHLEAYHWNREAYDTHVTRFPSSLVAKVLGYQARE